MKKLLLLTLCLLSACAQDPYKLEISNNLADDHGQSIYFRSSLRSAYAGQIRRILSKKFGEIGMKTATSAENATLSPFLILKLFISRAANIKTHPMPIILPAFCSAAMKILLRNIFLAMPICRPTAMKPALL